MCVFVCVCARNVHLPAYVLMRLSTALTCLFMLTKEVINLDKFAVAGCVK